VIVAIGRSGNHRKLGCPGEEMDKVYNRLYDPKDFSGKDVLVVGGGDSALESAIALAGSGAKVTATPERATTMRDARRAAGGDTASPGEVLDALDKTLDGRPREGLAKFRQRGDAQALQALEPILKIDPSDPSPWYGMGVIYEAMGEQKKARETFERYRREIETRWKKNPKDANTAFSLADSLSRLGQAESAISWARKGMALDPNMHDSYADVLAMNHRKHEAIEQLQLAIQNGYRWYIFIKIDPDLQSLHGEPEFEKLLAERIKT